MTDVIEGEKLLRRGDAARRLAVCERTVWRWAATGRLDGRKIGPRAWRVTEASVDALLRAGASEHGKAAA